MKASESAWAAHYQTLPIWYRPYTAKSPKDLAGALGLEIITQFTPDSSWEGSPHVTSGAGKRHFGAGLHGLHGLLSRACKMKGIGA